MPAGLACQYSPIVLVAGSMTTRTPSLPLLGRALTGIGIGCVETAEHAAVATHAPDELRGSAFGLLAGVQSLGNLAASAIAGILWTALSPTWAFAYLTAWMVIALIAFQLPGNRTTPPASFATD